MGVKNLILEISISKDLLILLPPYSDIALQFLTEVFTIFDVGIVVLPLQIMAASHLIFAFAVVIGGLVRPFDS